MDRTLAFAQEQGIPIWCAEEWLSFVEARDAARVEQMAYVDGRLSFSLSGVAGDAGLTMCLPINHNGKVLNEVRRAGEPQEVTTMTIQQRPYVFVPLDSEELTFEAYYR